MISDLPITTHSAQRLATPVFVVGSPRSGTTLLAGILNQFAGVHITRETGFIADLYQPGMNWLADPMDRRLEQLVDQTWSYLVRQEWKTRPSATGFCEFAEANQCADYSGFVRYCWQLEDTVNVSEFDFVGDNTPRYTLAIPLLNRLFPNAVYINLVRDGRDVVCSLVNRHFGANSLLCAARSWMDHIGSWQMAERIIPQQRRIELRYEDLVSDSEKECSRLGEFLQTTRTQSTHVTDSFDSHGIAGRLNHHSRLDSPIDDSSVGRFQDELTAKQLEDVEAVMYSGLVAYDYEVGPFRPSVIMRDKSLLLTGSHVLDLMKRFVKKVQPCP